MCFAYYFLYLKVVIFQPELRECAPRTTSVLKSCDFPAGAAGTLRILRLYLKVAIFQPELQEHAPRTTSVLKSCDFQAGAAADQGGIEPETAGLRKQARKPRDNFQRLFREQENRTAPQRERFDTHDLRRGFIGLKTDARGATARAIRHARSPQRVHRAQDKFARRHSESASTRTPQRVRQGQDKFARRHSESASTRTISAEGSPRPRQMRTAPQRERFDTHDPRRGFIGLRTNSHGATARALRHARSPQRVRRAQDKFARRHSESASTRTISAEGSSGSGQIRTAPQRERFDTHDLRRGLAALKTNLHGATARALRHARSPQRGAFRKLLSGLPPP